MTTHYSLRIVGLHYAANPTYRKQMGTVPEMEKHTVEVLKELDEKRPRVMLIPDPDNIADPHAVMARAEGRHIGYVESVDRELFFKLLEMKGKHFLVSTIDSVEVEERGKLYVTLKCEEGAERREAPWQEYEWKEWPSDAPLLPVREVWRARYEAEHMMDEELWPCDDPSMMDELECYLEVWMENSLYDISTETFRTCNRYIHRFASHTTPRIRQWAARLEKYRTAFYGAKRDARRMEWWESLQKSESMELLWIKWQYHCSYNLYRGLKEIDTFLRLLPDQLYSLIGMTDQLFKSLFYRAVPRRTLWGIYTALLLRIRTCREMGIDMYPLAEDSFLYGHAPAGTDTEDAVESFLPEELRTEEARELLNKFLVAGMLDHRAQPLKLSNTERGLLAKTLSDELDIEKTWKVFGECWGMNSETLRRAYNKALDQPKSLAFQDKMKNIMG